MAELRELEPRVLLEAPDAPLPLVRYYAHEVAVEFCRRTRAWAAREQVELPGGATSFAFPAPRGTVMTEVMSVQELKRRELRSDQYAVGMDDRVQVDPTNRARTLGVEAALAPAPGEDEVPDRLMREFKEALTHGVLARLLMAPGEAFSDPQKAAYHEQKYEWLVDEAEVRASNGYRKGAAGRMRYGGL